MLRFANTLANCRTDCRQLPHLWQFLGLKVDCVFGGTPNFQARKRLAGGVDILLLPSRPGLT
jgi:hypothetical protein